MQARSLLLSGPGQDHVPSFLLRGYRTNFRVRRYGEVRRRPIPRTPVNKGKKEKKGRDIVAQILASSK